MLNNIAKQYITPLKPIPTGALISGKTLPGIKCVLFDIYGTLFISGSGDISLSRNESHPVEKIDQLLRKFSIKKNPHTLLKELLVTIETKHEELMKKGLAFPEIEIDQIWMEILKSDDIENIRKFAIEYELIVNPVYPMPHLQELISACREKKITMGLISNAQFYTPYLFNWFLGDKPEHLGFHPDLILLSYRLGDAKPSLGLFRAAAGKLKEMDVPAHSVLFTGNDMLNDIYPAKQIGFKTALFAGDKRSLRLRQKDSRCQNLTADLVVTDLIQLLDFIN